MQLRYAKPSDKSQLSSLWITCFPGDEDFRDYFMSDIFDPSNAFVFDEDGKIRSMAYMLPMVLDYHSNRVSAAYIFAVGTDPDYRGHGLAAKLLERIYTEMRQRDIPLAFLVPQKEGLFDYYKRFGFAEVFKLNFETLVRDKLPMGGDSDRMNALWAKYELHHSSINAEHMLTDQELRDADAIYEKVMKYRDHLKRSTDHWRKAIRIGEIAGGGIFTLKREGTLAGYALCEWVGKDLLINELLAEDEESYNLLCVGVLSRMGASEATMLTTACPHGSRRFGMARVVDAEKMLAYAAAYRGDMDCAFEIKDPMTPWNNGRFEISGNTVRRGDASASRAHITVEQLTDILFSAGPQPYINLLFS